MNIDNTVQGEPLQVSGISKTFDGTTKALDDVSLNVTAGETLCLLGPSGCGKTTLLRCIAGLEHADRGSISLGQNTLSGNGRFVAAEKRRIGMVFQEWALFPHMSVRHNIAYGQTRAKDNDAHLDELLALTGLQGLERRRPHQLSGGQQQRVALARALARRPPLLLFDEPFSNLDAERRRQVRVEVARLLQHLSVTAVFVTHDQEEAFTMGNRVAVMKDGVVHQVDTPRNLYSQPASPWIAGFVGDANLVNGRAAGSSADTFMGRVSLRTPTQGEVRVLARPEALTLQAGGDAMVDVVEFYGHDVVQHVRAADGTEIKVRSQPNAAFPVGAAVTVRYVGEATEWWPASP